MATTAIMDHAMEHTTDIMMVGFLPICIIWNTIVTANLHPVKSIMNDSWAWLNSFYFCPAEPHVGPHVGPPNIDHRATQNHD